MFKKNAEKSSMNSNLLNSLLLIIILPWFVISCNEQGRTANTIIKPIGSTSAVSQIICVYIDPTSSFCTNDCDLTKNHVADKTERGQLETALRQQIINLTQEEQTFKINNFINAQNVCVEGLIVKRPENSVFVNRDYCSCLNSKRDISNNCESFCSSKAVQTPTLYGSVTLGPEVANGANLGTLERFCNAEIGDGGVSPKCSLRVQSAGGSQDLDLVLSPGSNSFSVNLSGLSINVPYTAKIIETGTNTNNASSNSFQFMRIDPPVATTPALGPLKLMAVSQYSCITRVGNDANGTIADSFTNSARLHFYFGSNEQPDTLAPGSNFLFCHDIELHPNGDDPSYPRLELIPQSFTLWDKADVRFRDANGDSKLDINALIQKDLTDRFKVSGTEINLFAPFQWPNGPNSGETPPTHGYFMQAFVDSQSGRAKCPNQDDYNGSDPLFRVLKDFIGVNTEAIFVAKRQPKILIDETGAQSNAPDDFLLIRETLLKKIWFYFENSLPVIPDDITVNQKTIMFYYPPDTINPYIRKSTQDIYIIKDISSLGTNATTVSTAGSTPDKRFGCIPTTE